MYFEAILYNPPDSLKSQDIDHHQRGRLVEPQLIISPTKLSNQWNTQMTYYTAAIRRLVIVGLVLIVAVVYNLAQPTDLPSLKQKNESEDQP